MKVFGKFVVLFNIYMKQSITKEQWNELKDKQKIGLPYGFIIKYDNGEIGYASIGYMIEFLGDYWCEDERGEMKILPKNNDLCDWLWKEVKYKLNKK